MMTDDRQSLEYYRKNIIMAKSKLESLLDSVEAERHNIKLYTEKVDYLNMMLFEQQIRENIK